MKTADIGRAMARLSDLVDEVASLSMRARMCAGSAVAWERAGRKL